METVKKDIRNIHLKIPADPYKTFTGICVQEDTNMRAMLFRLMNALVETRV